MESGWQLLVSRVTGHMALTVHKRGFGKLIHHRRFPAVKLPRRLESCPLASTIQWPADKRSAAFSFRRFKARAEPKTSDAARRSFPPTGGSGGIASPRAARRSLRISRPAYGGGRLRHSFLPPLGGRSKRGAW